MKSLFAAALVLGALLTDPARAARELTWEELVPEVPGFENPFVGMGADQLVDLGYIARVRELQRNGEYSDDDEIVQEAESLTRALTEQGVDVEELLTRGREIAVQQREQRNAVVETLDGQHVRMPGYVLPLEFDDEQITEFLLVPFVGACIHVPPPPPNQIVHVFHPEGFENQGLFTPVWVEGTIATEASNAELYLVDGASQVPTGYTMQAMGVEEYTDF